MAAFVQNEIPPDNNRTKIKWILKTCFTLLHEPGTERFSFSYSTF